MIKSTRSNHANHAAQQAILVRNRANSTTTVGDLYAGGRQFCVVERAWQENQRNRSCIPTGEYRVSFLPRSASGRYRRCWLVHDVPGRTGILIHNGNIYKHSRGCLLIGMRAGVLAGELATLNSHRALDVLAAVMRQQEFTLTIISTVNNQYKEIA